MNQAEGGNVIFKFKGDNTDLDKKTKEASNSLKGLGTIGKAGMVALGTATAAATAAVTALAKSSLNAYGEYEQLEGGLKSMLKETEGGYDRVIEKSKTAYKDLQLSQSQYLQSFESSYAIIKNGLSEGADGIEYTNKVLQISSDLFNTFGGSTEQYSNAINWALKGTFSYLDNLNIGIKGTQEGFVEAANASGVLGRNIQNVKELTNNEIIDVIQHYTKETGAWGKSTEEASTTIEGSLNMVKASWADFLSGQGGVTQVMESVIAAGTNIGKAIIKLLPDIIDGIIMLVNALIPKIPAIIQTIFPTLLNGVVILINSLIVILPQLVQQIANMLPTMIPMLISAILQIIPALMNNLPLFVQAGVDLHVALIEGLVNSIPLLIDSLPQIVEAMITGIMSAAPIMLTQAPRIIMALAEGLIKGIPKLVAKLPQIISAIVNGFSKGIGQMGNVGANLMRGLWGGISGLKDYVINKVKNMGKSILNSLKNVLGIHSPSTETAWMAKMSIVGYTDELDRMKKQLQSAIDSTFGINPQLANSTSTHYSPNIVVNNHMNMKTDPLGQMVGNIKTFAGGAKNDYNYGMGG